MPDRIQRRRTKGWRKPEGAIIVTRPGKWGNPFTIMRTSRQGWLIYDDRPGHQGEGYLCSLPTQELAQREAVKRFRKSLHRQIDLSELRGHDLVCWCAPGTACHADVLLELANR